MKEKTVPVARQTGEEGVEENKEEVGPIAGSAQKKMGQDHGHPTAS